MCESILCDLTTFTIKKNHLDPYQKGIREIYNHICAIDKREEVLFQKERNSCQKVAPISKMLTRSIEWKKNVCHSLPSASPIKLEKGHPPTSRWGSLRVTQKCGVPKRVCHSPQGTQRSGLDILLES